MKRYGVREGERGVGDGRRVGRCVGRAERVVRAMRVRRARIRAGKERHAGRGGWLDVGSIGHRREIDGFNQRLDE